MPLPIKDPLLLVSAMAHVTRHLGFGVTANPSWETPYLLAQRVSTRDHLTEGRIGWNIVTGHLASAARAMGAGMAAYDERYDLAEHLMALAGEFWEVAWEDGGLRNRARGDPARRWTVREVADFVAIGGVAPVLVGSVTEVADDAVEDRVDRTGVDGLNLSAVVFPETFERIAAPLVPERQRRGRVKRGCRAGTLREKPFGRAHVAEPHPMASYRAGWGGAGGGSRTHNSRRTRILSPLRLPIPPRPPTVP